MTDKSLRVIQDRLLAIVRQFLQELAHDGAKRRIEIDAAIEDDLGIDSLGRMELFHRLEKAFAIQLSENVMMQTNTLAELAKAIQAANPPLQYSIHDLTPQFKKAEVKLANANTLIDVLISYSTAFPDRVHIYLQDEHLQEKQITYGELLTAAMDVAKGLQAKGIRPGETVAIMLPTSAEFFYSFFGILLAGAIPVPIYPPFRADKIEDYVKREANILINAESRVLITFQKVETLGKILKTLIPSMQFVTTTKELMNPRAPYTPPSLSHQDIALIQYTSGSTGSPKGVQLGHHNLLANIRAYGEAIHITAKDNVVSWLPLYHDMGLIGAWLGSLYYGLPLTIMSPLAFLARPERWLWTIHYHRATLSAGPNFAYELCCKLDDSVLEGLDLRCWRIAANGAESIYPNTLRRFIKKFKPFGLHPEAVFPVYGLAESTVGLLFPPLGREPRIDRLDRNQLTEKGEATPHINGETAAIEFVACGVPMEGHAVRIVNEQGEAIGERKIGHLQFTGPSSMQGYYRNPTATQAIYHEGWWDTGDLAYQADGEIFITGRKKDLIIKAGRNIYPEEIETITATVNGIRKGCVVAFGISDQQHGTESLIVVAESRILSVKAKQTLMTEITNKIVNAIGIAPDEVIIAPPHTIPKTSSGKLRRSSLKDNYLNKQLMPSKTPIWLQFSKLFFSGFCKLFFDFVCKVGRVFYAFYAGLLLLLTLIPLWLIILISSEKTGRRLTKLWAQSFLYLIFCPLQTEGIEHIPEDKNLIYVANHASYADVLALTAALPESITFIAKNEFLSTPIIKTFISRLGQLTVERGDFTQSIADAGKLVDAVNAKKSLVIFPEGTFTYATGLRPFKTGAFKIAVESQTPICPVALKGMRQILRSNSLLPRPGKIKVTIGELIYPDGNDWQAITKLRTEARNEIAKHCGEFPIDLIAAGPEKNL